MAYGVEPNAFINLNRTATSGLVESLSDSFEEPAYSAAIFRDVAEESRSNNMLPTVCRANPIIGRSSCDDDWEMEGRVISPYPYSSTANDTDEYYPESHEEAVYLSFYLDAISSRVEGVDGDGVSFCSHDAESLGNEELGAIHDDPDSFWQTGAQAGTDEPAQ